MGKPATTAKNKYIKANFDKFMLLLPKGKKEEIQQAAGSRSLRAYITEAIEEKMDREKTE